MVASAYTPFDVSTKDRIVGIFVIGAVLLFLIGFMIPAIQRLSDDEGLPFYTVLDQTYGIAPEATVSLRGVNIGAVTEVGMTTDGMVRVDIRLSPAYQEFYTEDSRLEVDTNLSASTLLTGSGLLLTPGPTKNDRLEPGEFIPVDTPRALTAFLEELDVEELTRQITDIVANVESITAGMEENQGKIYASMDNLEQVTASLAEVSKELPGMVASMDDSLDNLNNSLAGVDRILVTTEKDLATTLRNSVELTEQATLTLAETEALFRATTPVMNQLPTVLVTTDVALQSITDLSNQMSRSWLFGGSGEEVEVQNTPNPHPHDDSLYTVPKTAKNE